MGIVIKASDLFYRYPKVTADRHTPKFKGKPDRQRFDRNDLYEVLPMLAAVMDRLERDDSETLQRIEELMIRDLPGFLSTREEVYDFLVGCMLEIIEAS